MLYRECLDLRWGFRTETFGAFSFWAYGPSVRGWWATRLRSVATLEGRKDLRELVEQVIAEGGLDRLVDG